MQLTLDCYVFCMMLNCCVRNSRGREKELISSCWSKWNIFFFFFLSKRSWNVLERKWEFCKSCTLVGEYRVSQFLRGFPFVWYEIRLFLLPIVVRLQLFTKISSRHAPLSLTLELPEWSEWPICDFLWKLCTFITASIFRYSSDL